MNTDQKYRLERIRSFVHDQSGAVTADWVIMLGGAIAILFMVYNAFGNSEDEIYVYDESDAEIRLVITDMAENRGYIDAPDRALFDRITRKIKVKVITFTGCLGFGMVQNGNTFKGESLQKAMCSLL